MSRMMKDSGIEWIGEIPESWKIKPNKWVMKKKKELCDKYCGEDILSLTMNGVVVRDLENPTGKMPLTFDGYQYIYTGNLLMCLFDIDVTPRCIGVINSDGLTSPAYSQFELIEGNERYYYYYYLNLDYTKELLHMAKNLRHSLTESQLGEIYVPVPSNEEQLCIANYLDTCCSLIDLTIEKQRRVIEKLQEYKQSVITEAVTKGLNPKVPMKDSGIEWIGEVPEHWNVVKLKSLTQMISKGTTPSTVGGDFDINGSVRFIKAENIKNNKIEFQPEFFIDEKTNELLKRSKLQNRDILFVIAGATIGKIALIDDEFLPANTNQAISFIRLNNENDCEFLYYYLQSDYIKNILNCLSVQSAQPNLSMSDMSNFYITYPNKEERVKIIKYLDTKNEELECVIRRKEKVISKLESYKKSLIYECVTGKREVK